jgi:hypothetical protein
MDIVLAPERHRVELEEYRIAVVSRTGFVVLLAGFAVRHTVPGLLHTVQEASQIGTFERLADQEMLHVVGLVMDLESGIQRPVDTAYGHRMR